MRLIRNFVIIILLLCTYISHSTAQSGVYEPEVLLRGVIDEEDAIGFFYYSNAFWVSAWDLSVPGNELGKLSIYRNDGQGLNKIATTILKNMPTDNLNGGSQNYLGFTTDGTYVYAVNYSRNIFVIDPAQYSVVDYITTSPETGFAAIAYDYEKDGFWCADGDGNYVWFVNKDGQVDFAQEMGIEYNRIVGLAYDDITDGGPYLWTAVSGSSFEMNMAQIGRFQMETGEYESFVINAKDGLGFSPTYGSYMGGIYAYPDYALEKFVLAGVYSSEGGLFAFDLGDISPKGTPRGVKNFKLTTKKEDGLNVQLSWVNPVKTIDHINITALSSANIYRDGVLVHTINNPAPGANLSWTDTSLTTEDVYEYTITISNETGEGMKVTHRIHAGEDTPGAPANVMLEIINSTTAELSWSIPVTGKSDGWFDEESLTYKVVRLPDNAVIAENISATTITDNTIINKGLYSYTITAFSRKGEGASATSNALPFGNSMTVPWYEYFTDTESIYSLWTKINNDGDSYEWLHNGYSVMGGSMEITAFCSDDEDDDCECDDWLISPAVMLEKDKEYRLRFYLTILTETNKALEVRMGKGATIEGQTTLLKEYTANVDSYAQQDIVFSVPESGEYNFGWHAMVGGEIPRVYLTNVSVEEVPSIDMAVSSIQSESEMIAGTEYTLGVKIKNLGKIAATGFKVNLEYSADGGTSVPVAGSPYTYTGSLAGEEEATVPFKFTPSVDKAHLFRASVELEGDIREENNSVSTTVIVYPEGTEKIYIGNPNTSEASQLSPFNLYYLFGAAQTLYYKDQLEGAGIINQIEYYYAFDPYNPVEDRPVKIYMAHTGWEDMYEGWISDDMTLVFEGTLSFVLGSKQKMTIMLDKPFIYNGTDNIVVLTTNRNEKSSNPMNQFDVTTTSAYTQRVASSNVEAFDYTQVGRINKQIPNTTFFISRSGGSLSGTVKDSNGQPVEGVVVGAENQIWTAVTDAQGKYEFPFFPANRPYTITANKPGYSQSQPSAITIADKENKTLDITMDVLQVTTVKVRVNDMNVDVVIAGANVILRGDAEYQALTGDGGACTFEDIYCSSYTLSVYKDGYQYYTGEITINPGDTAIPIVELQSCQSNPPLYFNVATTSDDWYNIAFTWGQPDGVTAQHFIKAYNIYVNDMLVETVSAQERKAHYNVQVAGDYTCKISAIWNDNCESERASSTLTVDADLWNTTVIADLPWEESFETGKIEGYWKEIYLNAYRTPWETLSSTSTDDNVILPYDGNFFISFKNLSTMLNITRLITPQFDLSNTSKPTLKFRRYHARQSITFIDQLMVKYKNAPDAEWEQIAHYNNYTTDWVETTLTLPNPSETYWIAFDGITDLGYGILLDGIIVYDEEACGEIANLKYSQISGTQDITLEWDAPVTKGVVSYTVMKGDVVVAENITAREYTDISVPVGQHEYSVIAKYNKTTCTESVPVTISVNVTPLSIDIIALETLVVKPNPAKTEVKFNGGGIVSVQVYSALGGLVDTIATDPSQSEHSMNVSNYAAGTYLFKFTTNRGETAIRKVVVKP